VAIIKMPGLTDDPERIRHNRLQHIAFEFKTLDELLGTTSGSRLQALCRLFSVANPCTYPVLEKLGGGVVNTKQINAHWKRSLRQ
jgi:hypothetical protein